MTILIKNLIEDIRTFFWFLLKGPSFYRTLFEYSTRKFRTNYDADDIRTEAEAWCQSKVISKKELYQKLDLQAYSDKVFFPEFMESKYEVIKNSKANFGGMGDIDLIYDICENIKAIKCCESGVAYGWSSEAILSSVYSRGGSLVSVDMPMIGQDDYHLIGFIVSQKYKSIWSLLRIPDMNGIKRAIDIQGGKNLDFFHYDSDKSYYGRKWSQPIIFKSLRKGGVFLSDDINDNYAFKEFVEANDLEYFIIEHEKKYVGIIVKN